MIQPRGQYRESKKDELVINTPKQCFNMFRDITAGLYEYHDDSNNLCNYPEKETCGQLLKDKSLPNHFKV